jgi:hypothetical protein
MAAATACCGASNIDLEQPGAEIAINASNQRNQYIFSHNLVTPHLSCAARDGRHLAAQGR